MSRSCVLTHASGVSSHVCVDARVACLNTHAHLRAVFRVSAQKRVFLHSDLHYCCSVVPHAFFSFPHLCANTPLFVSTHRIHVPDVHRSRGAAHRLCRRSSRAQTVSSDDEKTPKNEKSIPPPSKKPAPRPFLRRARRGILCNLNRNFLHRCAWSREGV